MSISQGRIKESIMISIGKAEIMKKRVYNILRMGEISKRCVSQRIDSRGYTLIEALLSFTVFFMISVSMPLVMKCFASIKQEMVPPHYYEWNLFNESLRNELWSGTNVTITPDKVSFTVHNETVSYEKYQHSIRRRVNNRGHEVVLQSVNLVRFSAIQQGVHMDVEFEGAEKAEGEFFYFSNDQGVVKP
ncbi:hypothetical protein FGG79_09610 [Bacillus sp. BHET2]|nr:hypothetical protein FGG79_09610 [Bacillus sp. BHET2]